MNELTDALERIADQLADLNETLTRIDDGLFHLNLHVGADVTPWTGGRSAGSASPTDLSAPPSGSSPMFQGIVKSFNPAEAFGFITPTGGGYDVFVHASAVTPPGFLVAGQRVVFNVYQTDRGPIAENVRIS